ncbi:STAS domain-containing protein [Brevibacillus sp. SYSU BS000544]|uniref:STAS domain-containing protein n=1 Tax=Brevibacillus sp. SYSU BS000544 TaxID=3416443 RepID=UPI003CE4FFB8
MNNLSNNSTPVEIQVQNGNGYQKISIKGKLLFGSTNSVKNKLKEFIGQADGFIIDLTELQFIDSTGFGVLINFAKLVGIQKIAIVIQDEIIRELFMISKLNLLFPLTASVDEAIAALRNGYNATIRIDEY